MTDSKSVKLAFDCVGGDFERAGEASSKIKKMLQRLGIPADIVRRIAIGTYEAEMNVIIHAGGGNVAAEVFPDTTVITVTDHGPGIPPEELPHLFDRYYRARQDAGKAGTGLGLSITKAILQQHDFPFGVNSTVGKGSTFWFEMKAPQ